jgi:hypothetical protein
MDEYEDAEPPYDSYWDEYIALFYEFEDIYYLIIIYTGL